MTVYAGTTFSVTVTATENQANAAAIVTLGQLPAGLTSTTAFPLSVTGNGTQVTFVADKTLVAGTYTISLKGTAGVANGSASLTATVETDTPASFFFINPHAGSPFLSEVAVPLGGSGQIQFTSGTTDNIAVGYEVQLSVSGLPAGTAVSISPQVIIPGQTVTVSLSASSTAPTTQNARIALIGTPSAPVSSASVSFLADVTPKPGSLQVNRTDYLSTEGSPYSAVYDPAHNLIFSSNPSWNRIDVISNATHRILKSVPVRGPRGVDIALDNSKVWVSTASQQVFSINTTSLAATQYLLPRYKLFGSVTNTAWQGQQILALADGTFLVELSPGTTSSEYPYVAVWDPAENTLTNIAAPSGGEWPVSWQYVMRTGDGKRVYSIGEDSAGESFWYDVLTKMVNPPTKLGGYALAAAVNLDGSRVVVYDANGLNMYDGNFNRIGSLPGGGDLGGGLSGGLLFSPDNKTLYEEAMPIFTPVIYTIDASSLRVEGIAPAMPMAPVMLIMAPSFFIPVPFAVDSTGMLLGVQDWGIAFEDSTFFEGLSPFEAGTPTFLQHMSPYAGPLAGGTTSGEFGNAFTSTPDVWYGPNRGTAKVDSAGTLTITSPPASAAGPVNLKFLFPDGTEVFDPLFFSYASDPQYAVLSGASPAGGVPGEIAGYGLPSGPSGGTVTVGGNAAAITTQTSQYLPFTGAPFPSTFLNFTVPAGSPGWADIGVDTPNGNGVHSKGLFYAQSVKDYASSDSFAAVLYDGQRKQLYLSAHDHIDVFSLTSNQFIAPLTPPAQGSQKQFAGLALTPDGSLLLAADLVDGSLAVINPDTPSSSYEIPIAAVSTGNPGCQMGPLYVASTSNQQAFVVTGGAPAGNTCGPGGTVYQVNLAAKSAGASPNGYCGGGNVVASRDGSIVVFGENPAGYGQFCTYDVSQNVYHLGGDFRASAAISGDANIASSQWMLADSTANVVGFVAQPAVYYQTSWTPASSLYDALLQPQLNDSGSLYYIAAPNFADIVDVQHGLLRMRFSLSETVTNTVSPVAIDSGGQHIYLITNAGLTIVDLGAAPLSIGHLNPSVASPGAQVTIRGSGFSTGLTATVGGQTASVNVVDENTLTLTTPAAQPGPQDIVLKNSDGSSYTLENGVMVQ